MSLLDEPAKVAFLEELSRQSKLQEASEQERQQKQAVLKNVLGNLTAADKKLLRAQMTFQVETQKGDKLQSMDDAGQIKSVESNDARHYKGFAAKDHKNASAVADDVRKGTERVMGLLEQLRVPTKQVTDEDGRIFEEPLFSDADIRRELFEPLVREGLMVETLVPRAFSATQLTLDKTMAGYEQTLKETATEAKQIQAATDVKAAGGKGTAYRVVNQGKQLVQNVKAKLAAVVSFAETSAERQASFDRQLEMLTVASDLITAVETVEAALPPDLVAGFNDMMLEGIQFVEDETADGVHALGFGIAAKIDPGSGNSGTQAPASSGTQAPASSGNAVADDIREATNQTASAIRQVDQPIGEAAAVVQSVLADGVLATAATVKSDLKELVTDLKAMKAAQDQVNAAVPAAAAQAQAQIQAAAVTTVLKLSKALMTAVTQAAAPAGKAVQTLVSKAVAAAFRAAAKPDTLSKAALSTPEPNAQGVIDTLEKAFKTALAKSATGGDLQTHFTAGGKAVAKNFAAAAKASVVLNDIRTSPARAFKSLESAGTRAIAKSLGAVLEGLGEDAPKDFDPEAAALKALFKADTAAALEKQLHQQLTALQEEEAVAGISQVHQEIDELTQQLHLNEDVSADGIDKLMLDEGSLVTLTEKLRTDRRNLQWAASLASALTNVGGGLVPVLNMAGLSAQLVVNIIQAAERWKLWYRFRDRLALAKKAGSALAPAIESFYSNKQEQVAYHTITDALMVADLVGASLSTSVVLAPIGAAVSKTAEGLEDAVQYHQMQHNESALKAAWQATRDALKDPQNRRLGLEAQLKNPSLAMHAVVWAAVTDKDPVARQMMNACGLNEQTLEQDSAGETAVRNYLQEYLSEDRQVLDPERVLRAEWMPGNLELTAACWIICVKRAKTKAMPPLISDPPGAIAKALKEVEHQDLSSTSAADLEKYQTQTQALKRALKDYLPIDSGGQPHKEMLHLVDRFAPLVDKHALRVAQQLASLPKVEAMSAAELDAQAPRHAVEKRSHPPAPPVNPAAVPAPSPPTPTAAAANTPTPTSAAMPKDTPDPAKEAIIKTLLSSYPAKDPDAFLQRLVGDKALQQAIAIPKVIFGIDHLLAQFERHTRPSVQLDILRDLDRVIRQAGHPLLIEALTQHVFQPLLDRAKAAPPMPAASNPTPTAATPAAASIPQPTPAAANDGARNAAPPETALERCANLLSKAKQFVPNLVKYQGFFHGAPETTHFSFKGFARALGDIMVTIEELTTQARDKYRLAQAEGNAAAQQTLLTQASEALDKATEWHNVWKGKCTTYLADAKETIAQIRKGGSMDDKARGAQFEQELTAFQTKLSIDEKLRALEVDLAAGKDSVAIARNLNALLGNKDLAAKLALAGAFLNDRNKPLQERQAKMQELVGLIGTVALKPAQNLLSNWQRQLLATLS